MLRPTGITADTVKRRLLGEGAFWRNYGVAGARVLGAVRDGTFDPAITMAAGDVAGAIGVLKGMDHIVSCLPTLQMTLLEITTLALTDAIPGIAPAAGTTREHHSAEWFGIGDGGTAIYDLTEDFVYDGSLEVFWDLGRGPVLLSRGTDYNIVWATGQITFLANVPDAAEATSTSGLNPVLDMTAHPAEVDAVIALDGGAPTPVVFAWAGCTTGALTAAQIQAAIQALGGLFGAVTCTFHGAAPNDYYLITGSTTGAAMSVVITDGGANSCTDELKLGVADGGTEAPGDDAANLTADYDFDPRDGVATHDVLTHDGEIAATDYLDNVAWVGRTADHPTEDMIIILHDAISVEISPWTLEEKGEVGCQVTFRGSFDAAAPQTLPFEIRRPLPA